jgi:hypothetical protein
MRIDRAVKSILIAGSCSSLLCVAASAAPPQALDKTVTVSFSGFTPALCANGRHNNRSRTITQRIYISTKGRLFVEGAAHSAVYLRKRRATPSQAAFHFSGSKLVGTFASSVSGARREIISFDPSFHGCTAQVIVGEEPSRPFTWISLSGVKCTGTGKTEISDISCSIADGNAFAR